MHVPETPHEAIQPYLSPDYWDGHMFGDGTLERGTRLYSRSGSRDAKQVVSDYVTRNRRPFPLETYHTGEEVDAAQWEPGTLLFSHHEYMYGSPVPPEGEEIEPAELPARPTDLEYAPGMPCTVISVDGFFYKAVKSLVVVTQERNGQNHLTPVHLDDIHPRLNNKPAIHAVPITMHRHFTVGKTTHSGSDKQESLYRVNALVKISEGIPAKKKQSLLQKVAQLSLRPQFNQ